MERKILAAILGFGLLVSLVSLILLGLPKDFIKQNMRFIAPLPPIAVAVYVYITKALEMPMAQTSTIVYEIARMSLVVGLAYFVLAMLLYYFVKLLS